MFMCVFSSAKGDLVLLSVENPELVKDSLPFQLSVGGREEGLGLLEFKMKSVTYVLESGQLFAKLHESQLEMNLIELSFKCRCLKRVQSSTYVISLISVYNFIKNNAYFHKKDSLVL